MTTREKIDIGKLVSLIAGFIAIVVFGGKIYGTAYDMKRDVSDIKSAIPIMQKDIGELKEVQKNGCRCIQEKDCK